MKYGRWLVRTIVVALFGVLIFMVVDAVVSLDYSRQHNRSLTDRCELLAKLASSGIRGLPVEKIKATVGPDAIVKEEQGELWIDDVLLVVKDGQVDSVDLQQTCH